MFTKKQREEIREVRIFYLIVEIVLVWLFVSILTSEPRLRTPPSSALLAVLFAAHGILHWLSPSILTGKYRWIPYVAVQGGIALSIVTISGSSYATFALFSTLIGEAVGMFRGRNGIMGPAVLGYAGLAVLSLFLVAPGRDLVTTLFVLLPIMMFVVVYPGLYGRQMEARERAETLLEELAAAHRRLAEYSARVEELTLTNERQRIARELHDTLAQGLAGVVLQLEAVDSFLEERRYERAAEAVRNAMAGARSALRESRNAIDNLRLAPGGCGSLEERIGKELERLASRGIRYSRTFGVSRSLPAETENCVMKIVTESITNILRHAGASEAGLTVRDDEDGVRLEIRDDGRGLPANAENALPGHYGILGMRERVRIAGGTFEIGNAEGGGTAVVVKLPLPQGGERS